MIAWENSKTQVTQRFDVSQGTILVSSLVDAGRTRGFVDRGQGHCRGGRASRLGWAVVLCTSSNSHGERKTDPCSETADPSQTLLCTVDSICSVRLAAGYVQWRRR